MYLIGVLIHICIQLCLDQNSVLMSLVSESPRFVVTQGLSSLLNTKATIVINSYIFSIYCAPKLEYVYFYINF